MQILNDNVLDLLSAASASVPVEAQFGLDAISPPLSALQVRRVLSRSVSVQQAVRQLVDPDEVESGYALVATLIDIEHPDGRIFLDDLAEMLALSPLVYRALRASRVDRRSAA